MPLDQLFIVNSCGFHKKICSEILSEKKPKFTNMYNDYFKFQCFFISKFSIYVSIFVANRDVFHTFINHSLRD